MSKADTPPQFEAAMEQLEELIESMESGDLSLEASLAAFEKGVTLTRQCQEALATAEQKVAILMSEQGEEQLQPLTGDSVAGGEGESDS